jgi:battenin
MERRQMAMNIGALYAVLGITLGSGVDLIFSNTVLDQNCP